MLLPRISTRFISLDQIVEIFDQNVEFFYSRLDWRSAARRRA
jgi:hypothetical protein